MGLEFDKVSKEFSSFRAVDCVNYTMKKGVYGLLGVNGAGKTTLMRMLCTIIRPTEGKIRWNGKDIFELGETYRGILGYLPQEFGYYPDMSIYDYLMYIASIKGIRQSVAKQRIDQLLRQVALSKYKKRRMRTLSGGMIRRVGIAQAMLNNPKILVLDEPTAGLDPKERIRIRNLISEVAKDKIVIIATHVVTDVEFIAKEIVMLSNGKIIRSGSPSKLLQELDGKVWNIFLSDNEIDEVNTGYKVSNISRDADGVIARIIADSYDGRWQKEAVRPNLEDLYLYLNGD